jgi:hypothetical protein
MKMLPTIPYASLAALCLLTGCSSYSTKPMLPTFEQNAAAIPSYLGPKDLYVAEYETGKIFLFKNNGFEPDGSITSGISGPWDITSISPEICTSRTLQAETSLNTRRGLRPRRSPTPTA